MFYRHNPSGFNTMFIPKNGDYYYQDAAHAADKPRLYHFDQSWVLIAVGVAAQTMARTLDQQDTTGAYGAF